MTERTKRKSPRPWTDRDRRPLATFRPSSMSAIAGTILREMGRPLHLRDLLPEVAKRLVARGLRLRTETPEASLGVALRYVQEIQRTGPGEYAWQGVADRSE